MLLQSKSYTFEEEIYIDKGSSGIYFAKVCLEDGTIKTLQFIKK